MKFSIRFVAVGAVILSLVFAAVSATLRARQLQKELYALRYSHGEYTQDFGESEPDRWECVLVGNLTSEQDDTQLVRIRNFQRYQIRIHFFDGATNERRSEVYEPKSVSTAIRMIPEYNTLFVHATTRAESETKFAIPTVARFFRFSTHYSGLIDNTKPVLGYGLATDASTEPRGFRDSKHYGTCQLIEDTCRKHKLKAVWLTIKAKEG